jgi:pimeloyl-ACP methyl ester carboxylesterase
MRDTLTIVRPRPALLPLLVLALAAACAPATADAASRLHLGNQTLHRCGGGLSGWCGSLSRPLDPAKPHSRHIRIGFRWLPASGRDSHQPALVAVEGGPGYPSIGSTSEYQGTYGKLLRTRNLLLVDNRGTGRSAVIDCPGLQNYTGSTSSPGFPTGVAACARTIERRFGKGSADLFATAYATADLSAVIRALRLKRVDMYGDSYGTWFVQSFISRHASQLHSVILDSAYPVRGLDPWYASSGDAFRAAMDAVCARDLACATAAPGSATARLGQLLIRVRNHPIAGPTRGASGTGIDESVDVRALADMVQDAGSDPVVYRELDASVRAALQGDNAPLLRLTAQEQEWNHGTNPASYFSDGLFFSVSCTDYPQLFDMRGSPDARRGQFGQAEARAPDAFSPFTPQEWLLLSAYSESYQACLDWPRPRHHAPPVPATSHPLPASVPLLVIGGDLDSLTPLSDAMRFAPTLGRNVRVITLRNTVHVTSEGDTYLFDGAACARQIIRSFVQAPARLNQLDARCAAAIPPLHTPGAFPLQLADAPAALVLTGPDPGEDAKRAVTVAAGALADASIRWYYSSATRGPGLRGGSFDARLASDGVHFTLKGVRYTSDSTVSGTGTWHTLGSSRFHGNLVVHPPSGPAIPVTVDWNGRVSTALATVGGATVTLPAP